MDKSRQLDAFNDFLRRMDDITRANIERRWNDDPRHEWGKRASRAVYSAEDLGFGNLIRAEARVSAGAATRDDGPVKWAAEGAANQIQAAADPIDKKKRGFRDGDFFFLPMFGFASPQSIVIPQAA